MENKNSDLLPWTPELSDDEQAIVDGLRRTLRPKMTFMRTIRTALKLTQKQVADALCVTQSNVSKMEASGDTTLSALNKMAHSRGMHFRLVLLTADGEAEAEFDLDSAA